MSVLVPQPADDQPLKPGHYVVRVCHPAWKGPAHDVDGVRLDVTIGCPKCARGLWLSAQVHRIAPDGSLTPSLVCPFNDCGDGQVRCDWHVFARLDQWPSTSRSAK